MRRSWSTRLDWGLWHVFQASGLESQFRGKVIGEIRKLNKNRWGRILREVTMVLDSPPPKGLKRYRKYENDKSSENLSLHKEMVVLTAFHYIEYSQLQLHILYI